MCAGRGSHDVMTWPLRRRRRHHSRCGKETDATIWRPKPPLVADALAGRRHSLSQVGRCRESSDCRRVWLQLRPERRLRRACLRVPCTAHRLLMPCNSLPPFWLLRAQHARQPVLENCLFDLAPQGGAIFAEGIELTVHASSFADNRAYDVVRPLPQCAATFAAVRRAQQKGPKSSAEVSSRAVIRV